MVSAVQYLYVYLVKFCSVNKRYIYYTYAHLMRGWGGGGAGWIWQGH
jgi:hypothetical protein